MQQTAGQWMNARRIMEGVVFAELHSFDVLFEFLKVKSF